MPPQAWPRARLKRTTNFALANGVETVVPFEAAPIDTEGGWVSTDPTKYTITKSGAYVITWQFSSTSAPDSTWFGARIKKNGTLIRPNGSANGGGFCSCLEVLAPGDVLTFHAVSIPNSTLAGNNVAGIIYRVNTDP